MDKNDFKKIDIYDRDYVHDAMLNHFEIKPYMQALVQELPNEDPDYFTNYRVLKVLSSDAAYKEFGRMPEFGDIVTSGMENTNHYKMTSEEYNECKDLFNKFDNMKATAKWIVRGSFYDELKSGQKYFEVQSIDDKTFELDPITGHISSIEDAENWLISNHPDFYMGCGISRDMPSGDFSLHAVPNPDYGTGRWETWVGRYEYVKALADSRGILLGPIEHDRDGKHINLKIGDTVRFVEKPDDKDNRVEASMVITDMVGEYPNTMYTMTVQSSDGYEAEARFPEGKQIYIETKDVGHFFSDIECDDKHMYLMGGLQKEYERDRDIHHDSVDTDENTLANPQEYTLPKRRRIERELPDYEPNDYPESEMDHNVDF